MKELTVEEAERLLKEGTESQELDYANIDYNREKRTGVPEVIYCAGKTADQVRGIVQNMREHGQKHILGTRCSREKYEAAKEICPQLKYEELSRMMIYQPEPFPLNKGKILIACAGTSDLPVAKEAALTARFLGNEVNEVYDVGVAGIHRLFARMDMIESASVIVAVAGMEGALASVIGGLTDKPVIAVPTSVGYGANFGGIAPLLAMLNSCASGTRPRCPRRARRPWRPRAPARPGAAFRRSSA
mgnify:CR=1 FL=1